MVFGRLLDRLFGRRSASPPAASRPVSPPPPVVPVAAPPPPPPPPADVRPQPVAPSPPPVAQGGEPQQAAADPRATLPEAGRVRIVLEDGTLADPSLDPELEERLRYIVDNIVPPSAGGPP